MSRYARIANDFASALGPMGVIGSGLLVFALVFALTALVPMLEELEAARGQRDRLAARLTSGAEGRPEASDSIDTQLARFLEHFPPPQRARREMLELQALAARHGLKLRSGEYRVSGDTASGLVRHQIAIPVSGTYLRLRAFVADTLEQLPTIALESASFKREGAGADELEARMTFTLYAAAS